MSSAAHGALSPPATQAPARELALLAGPDPDVAVFGQALAPSAPKHRQLRKLYELLVDCDPRADVHERERAIELLAKWVRNGGEVPLVDGATSAQPAQERRLRLLVLALELFPAFRERLSRVIQTLLVEQDALSFLARLGIPGDRGLASETVDRLSRRLMPQPVDEQDITHLVTRMFPGKDDPTWVGRLPAVVVFPFLRILRTPVEVGPHSDRPPGRQGSLASHPDHALGALPSIPDIQLTTAPTSRRFSIWSPLRVALLDGILLLASRVSAAGLSDAIRARSPACSLRESPFFRLPRSIDALLATHRHDIEEASAWADECRALVIECREASLAVFERLEAQVVSIDVVYRLELIDRSLDRIELLIELLVPQKEEALVQRSTLLLSTLLSERQRELSLSDIVRTNTRLLARKIIERAGQTGEHYITVTRGEYAKMLLSAGGGGLLTAGTTACKFFIGWLHRPPFQEGLLSAINYSGSFILMQFLGFTLATKQPSMTAAALAGSLKAGGDFGAMVTTIARITRSQLAAAIGNITFVIPACIAVDQAHRAYIGGPFLDAEYASYFIDSLHPTKSGTIAYAAFTGVLLWISSLSAGWLENWAVYRRLPEAIAEHRLRRIFGRTIMGWASRLFSRNIAGIGGNTTLGTMLAMVPIMGKFVGVPLDVRHVTLSTGALTLAVCTLGKQSLSSPELQAAALGIGIIGALNFGVSFVLALTVAMRAREVPFRQMFRLLFEVMKSFFRGPMRFFFPGKDEVSTGHGHAH